MTQKEFEKYLHKQIEAYLKNVCMFCQHDKNCNRPLHGRFDVDGEKCPFWEEIIGEEAFMWALQYFYGPAIQDHLNKKIEEAKNERVNS